MKRLSVDGWRRGPGGIAWLVLVLALALAACSSRLNADGSLVSGTVIDRFAIGNRSDCPARGDTACDESLRIATDIATGKRGVAADSIVSHRFYYELIPPGTSLGGPPVLIVVFRLADGSRVAIGVYCGVGPCQVVNR